jgi:hypothetical protein
MDKEAAKSLANKIGRKKLAETLGVVPTAVGNAVSRGCFPAAWFMVVSDLAEREGVNCPPHLFKMIPLDTTQSVDSLANCQETRNNPHPPEYTQGGDA